MVDKQGLAKTILCVGGLQASGKTTAAWGVARQLGLDDRAIVDPDTACFSVSGEPAGHMLSKAVLHPITVAHIAGQLFDMINNARHASPVIIVPFIFTSKALRTAVEELAKLEGFSFKAVWLSVPKAVAEQRAALRQKLWSEGRHEQNNFSAAPPNELDAALFAQSVSPSWTHIDATQPQAVIVDQICRELVREPSRLEILPRVQNGLEPATPASQM